MGIEYIDLYNKSRQFIEKGVDSRNENDIPEFLLWASISLELLGKATLAFVHPSLVADPNDPKSLIVACGHKKHDDFKTIQAKTVFERLQTSLSITKFDQRKKEFCMSFSNKRNAELHSGLLPFDGIRLEAILPQLWEICVILLEFQNKKLEEWIGKDEATRALQIIDDHSTILKTILESRVESYRIEYNKKHPINPPLIIYDLDEDEDFITCPACNNDAIAYGEINDKEYTEKSYENPWHSVFTYFYDITGLYCRYCDLKLNGYEEVEIIVDEPYFAKLVEEEPDYDYDYGND